VHIPGEARGVSLRPTSVFSLFCSQRYVLSGSLSHKSWLRSFFPDVNLTLIIEAGRDVRFQSLLAIQSSIILFHCVFISTQRGSIHRSVLQYMLLYVCNYCMGTYAYSAYVCIHSQIYIYTYAYIYTQYIQYMCIYASRIPTLIIGSVWVAPSRFIRWTAAPPSQTAPPARRWSQRPPFLGGGT